MAKAKPTYFCVVMPTRGARNGIGAVYGCSTKKAEAERVLGKAHRRGMTSLRVAETTSKQKVPPRWGGLDGHNEDARAARPPPVYHPRKGPPPGVVDPAGLKGRRSRRKKR